MKKEAPLLALQQFLPPGAYEPVAQYLVQYKVHLTITRERETLLGDYRNAVDGKNHRISVNSNLNPYAFLITLLHELAHLLTFDNFGYRVAAHGKEWKNEYGKILAQFLLHKLFPADIEKALLRSLQNPAATTCGEEHLTRVLRKYDVHKKKEGVLMVEELGEGQFFKTKDGRIFKRVQKLRKRYKCIEVKTSTVYLFNALYEVQPVNFIGPFS
ncbi:MAG: SprT-like domain-containing protein [Sphingobacteriales bacterium]|nr:SprT-like domain-containing protein [Sphingobacteriales bacterium]